MFTRRHQKLLSSPFVVTVALGAGVGCGSTVIGEDGDTDGDTGVDTGSSTDTGNGTGMDTSTGSDTGTGTETGTLTGMDPNCPPEAPVKGSSCSGYTTCVYDGIACGHYPNIEEARVSCSAGVWSYAIYTGTGTSFGNPPAPCPCGLPDGSDKCGVPSLAGDQELPCQYDACNTYECDPDGAFYPVPIDAPGCD